MHYYKFNIGDYHTHTQHLDIVEDMAYRRMLDWCYLHESPLPDNIDQIARLIRMRTHNESIALVLQEFFTLGEYGWIQAKVEKEIKAYQEKSEKAKASAAARWNKPDANALQTECEGNANHKPLTTNQEPVTNIYKEQALDCLSHLNLVTGRSFKTSTELEARLKEFSVDEVKRVIEYKASEWMGSEWQKYLRPKTLFNKTKFEGYLNDAAQYVPIQKEQAQITLGDLTDEEIANGDFSRMGL